MSNLADPHLVIPAGGARACLIAAEANLSRALADFLSVTSAIARTLDETDAQIKAAHAALTDTVQP